MRPDRSITARRLVAAALLLCGALASCKRDRALHSTPPVETAPVSAPARADLKLVVLVVVDQLPSWTFTRDAHHLEGGLARLLRESVYFPVAEYPYASTYTAPGHAAIGTGAPPSASGILANGWFRREDGSYLGATDDPEHPVFVIGEDPEGHLARDAAEGGSPATLRVEGIADALAREHPEARTVSVSLKQRAAILMTGRRPHLAVWYEPRQEAMTTSRFYADEPPAWLEALARDKPVSDRIAEKWDVEDHDFLEGHTEGEDDSPGEGENLGFDTCFPHTLGECEWPAKAIRATPAGVELLFDTARAALEAEELGKRGVTDLLAISVSSHDYAGHYWGQESWERFDILRRTDRALGELLSDLDRRFGADGYAVVVTSDHGAVPMIERSARTGYPARRVTYRSLLDAAQKGMEQHLGPGRWVLGYAANSIYLSPTFRQAPEDKRRAALDAAAAALRAVPGVGFAAPTDRVAGDCDRHRELLPRLVCASAHPEASGEIVLVPDRYSLFIEARFRTGTGHGTPSPECREVPLLVKRPGVEPRRASERVSVLQVAPTLAELLGVAPPKAATEEALPLRPER